MDRDNWTCQCCSNDLEELQVHHLKYKGNPWEVEDKHLITLCAECHSKVSKKDFMEAVRQEITTCLTSDMYLLKTHVRYLAIESLLTFKKSLS